MVLLRYKRKEEIKIYKQAKRFIVITVILLMMPVQVWADTRENYEKSRELYIAALACMAAYHDKGAKIIFTELENDGWRIYPYTHNDKYADISFLYARKQDGKTGKTIHLLAITGTEDAKDLKINMQWGKTDFEKGQNTENTDADNNEILKVHTGFLQYLNSVAQVGTVSAENVNKTLLTILLENPDEKLYLVGHSLGGAMAVLGSTKLLELGVGENQIKVITFGAPAVGNKAFAEKFKEKLNITRVVNYGDPIPGTLQKIPGGYVQFGQEIEYASHKYVKLTPHKIAAYLDTAMRNYFEARFAAQKEGIIPKLTTRKPTNKNQLPVPARGMMYIAPVKNDLPENLETEFVYIKEVLLDEYRKMFPGYVISEISEASSPTNILKNAKEAGCELVIFSEITGHSLKNKKNEHYLTLSQTIYRVSDRSFLKAASFANNTKNFTPLISSVYNAGNMQLDWLDWLKKYK